MELTNTQRLSPEARSLIGRSIDWLTPKGRWYKGWGKFKVRGTEIELDEMDDLLDRSFETMEVEFTSGDAFDYQYDELGNLKKHPDQSCLVGSLIINNDYKRDDVFEEAVLFLDRLARKHELVGKWAHEDYYGDKFERAVENLISFNDSAKYSHKRHVLDLFRRAIRKK